MTHRILAFLTALSALLFLIAAGLQFNGPQLVQTLPQDGFHPLRGKSFAYVIPRSWASPFLHTVGDDGNHIYSRLVLTENGVPLGQPHSSATAIDTNGGGRYVHMRANELYFSSSDGSDPRSNGRVYQLSVPLTPPTGLPKVLLATTMILLGAWALASRDTQWRWPGRTFAAIGTIAAFALIWQFTILGDAPRIIASGDGGVVAGIAAARLWPERMASDIVYGNAANFSFYQTLTIPFTVALTRFTGDIGQSYAMLAGPLLFIQMIGFYWLGRRLCPGHGWPLVLALLSVAPVYAMGGELWGSLSEPLTRYTFNAALPFILIAALPPFVAWKPFVVMLMCGFGVYLHPVSAPSVALAFWIAFAVQRPANLSWTRHLATMVAAGCVFLIAAIPFAVSFVATFPGQPGTEAAETIRQQLNQSVGKQYLNVFAAMGAMARYLYITQQKGFGWLWLAMIAAIFTVWKLRPQMPERLASQVRFIGIVGLGVLVSSIGLTAIDQGIGLLRGRSPVQIDLIRNVRFVIPIVLVLAICGVAWLSDNDMFSVRTRRTALGGGAIFAVLWALAHASVPVQLVVDQLDGKMQRPLDGSAQRALATLGAAPSGRTVMTLPAARPTEASELLGLAVRYAGRQPNFFLQKDINLLSYSSSDQALDWETRRRTMLALETATDGALVDSLLAQTIASHQISYVLVHSDTPAILLAALQRQGSWVGPRGEWSLLLTGHR